MALQNRVSTQGMSRGGGALLEKGGPLGNLLPNATFISSNPRSAPSIAGTWLDNEAFPAAPARPCKYMVFMEGMSGLRGTPQEQGGPLENRSPNATLIIPSPRYASVLRKKELPGETFLGFPPDGPRGPPSTRGSAISDSTSSDFPECLNRRILPTSAVRQNPGEFGGFGVIRGIPQNSAEFGGIRRILLISYNFAEFRGIRRIREIAPNR